MLCISDEHIRRYNMLNAKSGNTKSTPYQVIQDVQRRRKCFVCLKNNICATSENTMYSMPHQEIQKVYIIYTGCMLYQERPSMPAEQHIRHIRIYNVLYATSGNKKKPSNQEIQDVRHIRKYKKYATSENKGWTPYQEMLRIIHTPHQGPFSISLPKLSQLKAKSWSQPNNLLQTGFLSCVQVSDLIEILTWDSS